MTISSSLNAGVAGLNANASRLATISDNIANSSTFGYKRVESDFQSMVLAGRGGGSYTAGGVRSNAQRMIDQGGSLVSTSNATDLAVSGRGFLPVTTAASVDAGDASPELRFTTTGSYRADAQGYLRTSSGLNLMGIKANDDGTIPSFSRDTAADLEPIQIDTSGFVTQPTQNVGLGVNLPATATEPSGTGATQNLNLEYIDNLGKSQNLSVKFAPEVPPASNPASNTWTLRVEDAGGRVLGAYKVPFDATSSAGGSIDNSAKIDKVLPYTGPNTWDNPTSPTDSTNVFTVDVGTSAAPQQIAIDVDGLTQLSDSFAPLSISKDGSGVGNLVSTEVDENGLLTANFDSGATRTLYQIPLADMPNPNGMTALDDQTYAPTRESGAFVFWDAGAGPTGGISGFAREESTTDVAGELTDLIQTQRAYSSNAKVIQTVDEMLQETTNIKR